jgi:hypothetical protein
MAGDQTHGYDLVLEFAEQAYQELLSVLFDTDGFLFGTILGGLGIDLDPSIGFSVTVAFDRPGGIPANATDTVDIQVLLGDAGSTGSMRIVASVDVDSSAADTDLTQINLKDKLWLTEIDILGHSIPGLNGLFAAFLRNKVEVIPLLPWPVDRATTSNTTIKAADTHIVDDTSPADRDASAFLVTFGNGTAGNRNAFSQSFISPGGNGGLAVSFAWICRVISPMIDEALNLGGAFQNCQLTRTVRVDEDNEVDLTGLSITPDDGFIHVVASVSKSGFCYSATGTVGAKIKISVTNGNLQVEAHVYDPNVDVDIPWYCWIAGAVIGALLGGLLFGVIGAIVGAVLVPVITFVAQEVIEGIVNGVAAKITEALNKITPSVDIPAVGFNLIFSDAFIDDVQIDTRVQPIDTAPVRATGTILVPNGAAVDLDSGKIGPRDMPGGDIAVLGSSFLRQVEAVCGARWARTGLTRFDDLYRAAVYGYAYAAPNPVPLTDLAQFNPLGQIFGNPYDETLRIYGVRTNEGRWAAIQAVDVTDEAIRFRYITWEKAQATVQIVGAFTCDIGPLGGVATAGTAVFVPSAVVGGRPVQTAGSTVLTGASTSTAPAGPDPCVDLRRAVAALNPAPATGTTTVDPVTAAILALPADQRRIGRWIGPIVNRTNRSATFDAKTDGMGPGQRARWQLNGTPLEIHSHGDVDLGGGAKVHYHVHGKHLDLTMDSDHAVELLLAVTVVDDRGDVASTERCIHFEPTCKRDGRVTPPWADYQTAWLTNFGVVEVEPPPPPVVIT